MREPDMDKLNELVGRFVGDFGACATGAAIVLGDRLGLFKTMGDGTPYTSAELARKTGYNERNLREWLSAMAASGYMDFDAATSRFSLSPEQAFTLAEEQSPAFFAGGFEIMQSLWIDNDKVAEAFKSGKGLGWHEHSACLFRGTERFFRPGYNANLLGSWIPALEGVQEKLEKGAKVADVGCGHGASTVLMAGAFPKSSFYGFDYHGPSIEKAEAAAKEAGVTANTAFETATAKAYPARGYDLVAFFDCLHDMGDPVGAGKHVRETLADDGTWMIVEPFAHDRLEQNFNPVGRLFYAASTMICTPASMAQEVGLALGAQAGEARMRDVVTKAGFSRFRRATETPFNIIYEARP